MKPFFAVLAALFVPQSILVHAAGTPPPNVVFILIDDIGWGDLSCYGSPVKDSEGNPITPNLDKLAAEGTRFNNGYVASPICSPSRVGILTGAEPARHAIYSFLETKAANSNRNMNDWLQPDTVTSARLFRDKGYATGLFGKWHMGGGRDVNDAPFPQDYGFQASLTSFEGMGDRLLYNGHGLSQANADVPGTITWTDWHLGPKLHTDAAISFINQSVNDGKPFFIHVPYDDTHSPYHVAPGHENDFAHVTTHGNGKLFLGELNALDKQIGRLVETIDGLGLRENTLILVVGDNGAPVDEINTILNRNGGLRSGKGKLWEGGIRVPFLARMPGTVAAATVNTTTAISTLDLLPTYCALAGIPLPEAPLAGENLLDVLEGGTRQREKPLFWEYGTVSGLSPSSPKLVIRRGDLKFLCNPGGLDRTLIDLSTDPSESSNLAEDPARVETVAALQAELLRWYDEVVLGNIGETYQVTASPAGLVIADTYDVTGGNSSAGGFGAGAGLNQDLGSRLSGRLANSLSYLQTNTSRAASSHSITGNALEVARVANSTAFGFTKDGVKAYDFGDDIRGRNYEWRVTLDLDDPTPANARMTLGIADSPGPAGGVGGHVLGIQLDVISATAVSVFKRIDVGSHSGAADINSSIRTGLPAFAPVEVRVVMSDSTDYSGYHTTYQVFLNNELADSGNIRFTNDSRYFIFDVAGSTGPARYDNFSLQTTSPGPSVEHRIPLVKLSSVTPAAAPASGKARLYWTTRPGEKNTVLISSDLNGWTPLLKGGVPVTSHTLHGTISWLEVEVPPGYETGAFFRLESNP